MYVCNNVLYNIHNPGSQAESYSFSIFNTSSEEPFVSPEHIAKLVQSQPLTHSYRHENT